MAEKIYTPIEWHDDGPPDLNAENLNHIEKGIDDLDRSLADRRKEIELLQTAIEELKTTLNDTITEKLESKIDVSRITNDLLATEPGFVLDARQGKALKDLVNQQNSDYELVLLLASNTVNTFASKKIDNFSEYKFIVLELRSNENSKSVLQSAMFPTSLFKLHDSASDYVSAEIFANIRIIAMAYYSRDNQDDYVHAAVSESKRYAYLYGVK